MDLYNNVILTRDNKEIKMDIFKGKVLLIVNTATGCGFTPQYEGLEKLYKKYHDKGFEVLDFPCNQFANQAPGTDDEIHEFCTLKYNTSFDQFKKIEVNGKNESPLYTYLKSKKKSLLGKNIKWNFTKFLVDREGNVVGRYEPTTTPEKLYSIIEGLL